MRRWWAAAAVAVALCAAPAVRAGSPACPTLVDPAGDAGPFADLAGSSDPAGDLLRVDVGSDGTALLVVLTLAALDPPTPAGPVKGHVYDVYLDDGEDGRELSAALDGLAPAYEARRARSPMRGVNAVGESFGPVSGSVDVGRRQVRMRVPLAQLRWPRGHRTEVSAVTWESVGTPGALVVQRDSFVASSDFSDTQARYAYGARGCRTAPA